MVLVKILLMSALEQEVILIGMVIPAEKIVEFKI